MGDDSVGIVHPCKVSGAMGVSRPLLLLGPAQSHIGDLIQRYRCGWHVPHGDADEAERVLRQMLATPPAEPRAMGLRAGQAVPCPSPSIEVRFQIPIPTCETAMLVTDKGQVTIPKHIREAAGVAPGSEVTFSLEGSRIIITPVGTSVKGDRRAQLRAAAARVRGSFNAEFNQLGADEIMSFIRGDEPIKAATRRGSR